MTTRVLEWLQPTQPLARQVCRWLDSLPSLTQSPDWQGLIERALGWLNWTLAVHRDRPTCAQSLVLFRTERGHSCSYPYPALVYVRWLAIETWREAVRHLNELEWPNALDLQREAVPKFTRADAILWCLRVARLIQTVLVQLREWLPLATHQALDAQSWRDTQTALLALAQVLWAYDQDMPRISVEWIQLLHQSTQLLSTLEAGPRLPHWVLTTRVVKRLWAFHLAERAYLDNMFELAYFCYSHLSRQPGESVMTHPEFVERYGPQTSQRFKDLLLLDQHSNFKNRHFYEQSDDLFHREYRIKYYYNQGRKDRRPIAAPAPLQFIETTVIITPLTLDKQELWPLEFKRE